MNTIERECILEVLKTANVFGYGNLITWLNTAWKQELIEGGLPEATAARAVFGDTYPLTKLKEIGWIEDEEPKP